MTVIGGFNPLLYLGQYIIFWDYNIQMSNGFMDIKVAYEDIKSVEIFNRYTIKLIFKRHSKQISEYLSHLGTNELFIGSVRIRAVIAHFRNHDINIR